MKDIHVANSEIFQSSTFNLIHVLDLWKIIVLLVLNKTGKKDAWINCSLVYLKFIINLLHCYVLYIHNVYACIKTDRHISATLSRLNVPNNKCRNLSIEIFAGENPDSGRQHNTEIWV